MSDKKFVTYEDFGAVGDGLTDDFAAICRAHDYANENGLPVKANGEKTYYVCNPVVDGEMRSAYIKTDVDWGSAKFIIDDTPISLDDDTKPWHGHIVFMAVSDHPKFRIDDEATLREISEAGITKKSTTSPMTKKRYTSLTTFTPQKQGIKSGGFPKYSKRFTAL